MKEGTTHALISLGIWSATPRYVAMMSCLAIDPFSKPAKTIQVPALYDPTK